MIIGIALVVTVFSIIGCIEIKKPAIRGFLGMMALISIMIVALAGSFTYEILGKCDIRIPPDKKGKERGHPLLLQNRYTNIFN